MARLYRNPDGNLTDGRFIIEADYAVEDCECPIQLCQHSGGYREVKRWTVWDSEKDDHAAFQPYPYPYHTQRDARAALERATRS